MIKLRNLTALPVGLLYTENGKESQIEVASVFTRIRKISKIDYLFRHVRATVHPSVRPYGTTGLPLEGF